MPLVMGDLQPTHEAKGVTGPRRPDAHAGLPGQPFDDARLGGLLEDNQVRPGLPDDLGQTVLSSPPAEADVVTEQFDRHAFLARSIIVRYGSPMKFSRTYMTRSVVAWTLTGRPTIC